MLHSYVIKYIHIIRDVKGINQASCAGDVCHYSLSIRNPQFWKLSTTETKGKSYRINCNLWSFLWSVIVLSFCHNS
jgi:hypothetical protein